MEKILSTDILETFHKIDEKQIDELLKKEIEANRQKIVVLDDDPTGVQTVHDVSVYTDWSVESMREGFAEKNKLFSEILCGHLSGILLPANPGDDDFFL